MLQILRLEIQILDRHLMYHYKLSLRPIPGISFSVSSVRRYKATLFVPFLLGYVVVVLPLPCWGHPKLHYKLKFSENLF